MSERKVVNFENPTNEDLLTALRVCGDDSKGCRVCPLFKTSPCSNLFDVVSKRISQQADLLDQLQRETEPVPLTLEELLKMEGHPIWTSTIGVEMSGRYELCTGQTLCVCPLRRVLRCVTSDGELTDYEIGTYGKTWIAYATEPKGEPHA